MNLVNAIQAFLPKAVHSRSDVDAIVAGIEKAPDLIAAERDLAENTAAQLAATKRLAEIFERLNFNSPVRPTLFKSEQDELEVERADLAQKVGELADIARQLRGQLALLMPAYARSVASALASFRNRAAEQLLDSVGAAEEALDDIRQSNKALTAVGLAPPQAFALPYAAALRGLAEKVLLGGSRGG